MMKRVTRFAGLLMIAGALIVAGVGVSHAGLKETYAKFVDNAEKMASLQEGQAPQPPLSDEEIIELITPMKQKYAAAGQNLTDLQLATILGIIGGAEAFERTLKKAFSTPEGK